MTFNCKSSTKYLFVFFVAGILALPFSGANSMVKPETETSKASLTPMGAIGISPALRIVNTSVVKAPSSPPVEETFTLFRTESATSEVFSISTSGESKDTIILSDTSFTFPVGVTQVSYKFKVNTTGLAYGKHEARIVFSPEKIRGYTSAGVGIRYSITGRVVINVSWFDLTRPYEVSLIVLLLLVVFVFLLKKRGYLWRQQLQKDGS